jgi:hypothetical protein
LIFKAGDSFNLLSCRLNAQKLLLDLKHVILAQRSACAKIQKVKKAKLQANFRTIVLKKSKNPSKTENLIIPACATRSFFGLAQNIFAVILNETKEYYF